MGILFGEDPLMLHNRRGKMIVGMKTNGSDIISTKPIDSIEERKLDNPRTELDYVEMKQNGRMFTGKSADGSDMTEFQGFYTNPDNPEEWSNQPYPSQKKEMDKHQRIVDQLKRRGQSLQDAVEDIENKRSTFSRTDREYLLEWNNEILVDWKKKSEKGGYEGLCNRSACLKPGAKYFNHSTEKYYCSECAKLINDANRKDSIRLYGHDLCMYQPKELKQ